MKNIKPILFLILSLISFTLQARDIRILAIGNSFSEDAVEQYLYELAAENGDNLIIGNAYRGGQGLDSHWNVASNNTADFEYRKIVNGVKTSMNNPKVTLDYCLTDDNWDYITFQQVSQDSGRENTYEPYLTNLLAYAKARATNPDVQYALHRTWAYSQDSNHGGFGNYDNDQLKMYKAIVDAVNNVAANHTDISFIIPAGTAIQNGRTSFLGDIFCRDGYHLSEGLGRYTAACTWLEVFTGKSPVGNPYRPANVSEIEAVIAQYAAHYAVETPNDISEINYGFDGDNTIEPTSPVKVNFGSISTAPQWNSISPSNKYMFGLKDAGGEETEIVIMMDDDFNGTNTEGVNPTTTVLDMPQDVAASCVWGYAQGTFGGNGPQETGGLLLSHLNKNLRYDFYVFGSRKGQTDNRETQYVLQGENRKRDLLDASSNGDKVALIKGIQPNEKGEIRLTVSAGDNNTNGNKFYYLNALQIVARQYEDGDDNDNEQDVLALNGAKGLYLKYGQELDLSTITASNGTGIVISFATESDLITIDATTNKVTIKEPVTEPALAVVTASAEGLISVDFTIGVMPDVIEIASAADVTWVTQFPAGDFKLMQNIDLTDITFTGLCSESAPFTGTFDGQGYVIKGAAYTSAGTSNIGFFRQANDATIKNLGLENASFTGNENVGGIVGLAINTTIEQCYVVNSYVEARDRAGAIAGRLDKGAIIRNCYASGEMKAREHQVGGIVGAIYDGGGTVSNSYFAGTTQGNHNRNAGIVGLFDRQGSKVENCLNLATSITGGNDKIRRIADDNGNGTLSNNYSIAVAGLSDGTTSDGNGETITAAQAVSKVFYTETLTWDFATIWAIDEGNSYPTLKVFDKEAVGNSNVTSDNRMIVFSATGAIEIIATRAEEVKVYSVDGVLVRSLVLAEGYNKVDGLARGLYLVDNEKVMVK